MGAWVLIDVTAAAVALLIWYVGFSRYNRRRGAAILDWVQTACLGKGRILNPRWQASSSLLKATLHLSSRWFDEARLTVRLVPRPLPLGWVVSRWHKQGETLTFEADMGFPPVFHLDVIRHRWSGQTGRKTGGQTGRTTGRDRAWTISRPGPVILTTKEDWPAELTPVVNALASWHDKDFVSVRFNPSSPHFTATVALDSLSDQKAAAGLLGLFRELAASSSAKQH
ncbi:MAG: hypothetical protein WCC22_07275 [Terriglobales bacterium]